MTTTMRLSFVAVSKSLRLTTNCSDVTEAEVVADRPEALDIISDIISASYAVEELVSPNVTEVQLDGFEMATDHLELVYADKVSHLVERGTTTAEIYAEAQLRSVQEALTEGEVSTTTAAQIQEYLEDAQSFTATNDIENVILELSDAEQIIRANEYLQEVQLEDEAVPTDGRASGNEA